MIKRVRVSVEFVPGADFGLLDNLVVYSAIPEPGRAAAALARGLVGFAVWRRRAHRG